MESWAGSAATIAAAFLSFVRHAQKAPMTGNVLALSARAAVPKCELWFIT